MVFSSLLFTFFFLPVVLILYYLSKKGMKNYILLAASLFFYGYGEPVFVFVMLASILINYGLALLIDRVRSGGGHARPHLALAVIVNLGLLFVFKYLSFTLRTIDHFFHTGRVIEIALPIGISFFTFQALSYVIDVYRGTVPVQKNPMYLALYISFFPQLIAGPIVRYHTIEQQIRERSVNLEKFSDGARRFLYGFCKKVLIANNLSVVATRVFDITNVQGEIGTVFLWMGALAYTLQIYYDFSGYSDMAIGLGKLFGFTFEENFRDPYMCDSVTDYWRRWHISLGSWFRDYVYFPLGGSRCTVVKQIRNLLVVWALTGIWHGANWTFFIWGLLYFVMLVLEKFVVKPSARPLPFRILWRIVSLTYIVWCFALFNSQTFTAGRNYMRGMFGGYTALEAADPLYLSYFVREFGIYFVMAIVLATPVFRWLSAQADKIRPLSYVKTFAQPLLSGFLFLWAVSFLILGVHNPFIYFNF